MDKLLLEISPWVLPSIYFVAAVGVICAAISIIGMFIEDHRLKVFRKKVQLSDSEKSFEMRKQKLSADIEGFKGGKSVARVGQGRLLQLRLETINEAVNQKNAKVLPSLHDLHSLSVQDEMSRLSSCCLRTITSFLLIMGILGTLTGVHKAVSGTDIEIPSLALALQPSMYAVFFTIVLMWLRGWYVARMDGYLEKLDLFTMTELIPFMQPVSATQDNVTTLQVNLEKLENAAKGINSMNAKMHTLHENVVQYEERARTEMVSIVELKNRLDKVYQHLTLIQQNAEQRKGEMPQLAGACVEEYEAFKNGVQQVAQYAESVDARCAEVSAQYHQLLDNINTVVNDVQESRNTMDSMVDKAHNMNEMGKIVSNYDTTLRSMNGEMEQVKRSFIKVQELRDKVVESENLVNDSSELAAQMLTESGAIVDSINFSNAGIQTVLESGQRDVEAVMLKLDEQLGEFVKLEKELVGEWEKLASEMALG